MLVYQRVMIPVHLGASGPTNLPKVTWWNSHLCSCSLLRFKQLHALLCLCQHTTCVLRMRGQHGGQCCHLSSKGKKQLCQVLSKTHWPLKCSAIDTKLDGNTLRDVGFFRIIFQNCPLKRGETRRAFKEM